MTREALQAPNPGHKFKVLDGMRGVAAMTVVIWHTEILFGWRPGSGYLAVDLFFSLSGFVLAHAYDRRFERGMTVLEFMRARVVRLYPLYILGMGIAASALVLAMIVGIHSNWDGRELALSGVFGLFFLPVPPGVVSHEALYPLDVPAWSLAFELLVNFAFALVWRRLSVGKLAVVSAASAASLVWTLWAYGSVNVGSEWSTAAGALPCVFFSFGAGMLLYRLFAQRRFRLNLGPVVPVIGMLILLVVQPASEWRVWYDAVCVFLLFPVLIFSAAGSNSGAFSNSYDFIGLISYAVYVLHVPMLGIARGVLEKISHGRPESLQPWPGVGFAVCVILVAYLFDRIYDGPIRKWLTARLKPSANRTRVRLQP